ncbi:hypothetical protein TNCT_203661 [Trichonephila clavata]|uniref:Uncharacterized protein n=1 Tax=Trichonephila clavata TaxID=2740835 RepID=A0A8X6KC90_TRICU|nr:hypothetical protein TNCT_203661 [Trichonephila clavata]
MEGGMDVDPDRQMESCSSAASSNAAFDDECKTSNSCEEFAYPEPIRGDKDLQEEKEDLEGGGQKGMDVDPNRQMVSCSSVASSNAAFDDECKTSNSCEEFAFPEPIRGDKDLQEEKEELEGGQKDMDVDPNRQMVSCSSAASSNAEFDDECKTSNSCEEFAFPEPIRGDKDLQEEKEELEGGQKDMDVDPNRQMVSCSSAASSNAAFDDECKTSNSCEELTCPESTRHDKELQEEQEEIEWITAAIKKKLVANGEMPKLLEEAHNVLINEGWNLVVVSKCREFISQYGKGVTHMQLFDYCKEHCMKHIPGYVKDHLLKKVEDSTQKEVKKIKKVKKQKQVKEPNEVMQSEEVEEPKEVMQSEEVEKPKEVMQSEEVEKPKEVMQSEEVEKPKKVMQSEEVEQPKEVIQSEKVEQPKDEKHKEVKKIKKDKKGKGKKRK